MISIAWVCYKAWHETVIIITIVLTENVLLLFPQYKNSTSNLDSPYRPEPVPPEIVHYKFRNECRIAVIDFRCRYSSNVFESNIILRTRTNNI